MRGCSCEYESVREVEDDGAVLVQPDRFLAWRSQHEFSRQAEGNAKLLQMMRSVLGL